MNQLKAFALGVIKIAAALFVAVIALGVVWWGGYTVWQGLEKAKHAPLAQPKTWPSIKVEVLENTQLKLLTMWRDGRLYYQFSVNGYPNAIAVARDGKQGASFMNPQFTISFLDENRFKLFDHTISLISMAKEVDSQGRGAGLNANNDTHIDPEIYRRATTWDITWNFSSTAAAPEPPRPTPKLSSPGIPGKAHKWRDTSLWRTLKRGMSKSEVRQILGEPTKIVEMTLFTTWYYGYPLGGDVSFSRSDTVERWSEP